MRNKDSNEHIESLLPKGIKERLRGLKIVVWSPDRIVASTVVLSTLWDTYGGIIVDLHRRRCYLRGKYGFPDPCAPTRIDPIEHIFVYNATTLDQLLHLRDQGYHLLKVDSSIRPRPPKPGILGVPTEGWKLVRFESMGEIRTQPDSFWDSIVMSGVSGGRVSKPVIEIVKGIVSEEWTDL
jgi:hypothetical protein